MKQFEVRIHDRGIYSYKTGNLHTRIDARYLIRTRSMKMIDISYHILSFSSPPPPLFLWSSKMHNEYRRINIEGILFADNQLS